VSDWKKIAQEAWYGWREAAEQYHRDRAGRPLIAEIEHGRLKQLRDLLKDGTSLSRAYHEINTRRDGGAPQPTVEALMYSLRERGIKALEEVATKRRLSLLNEASIARRVPARPEFQAGNCPCVDTRGNRGAQYHLE